MLNCRKNPAHITNGFSSTCKRSIAVFFIFKSRRAGIFMFNKCFYEFRHINHTATDLNGSAVFRRIANIFNMHIKYAIFELDKLIGWIEADALRVANSYTAGENISIGDPVYLSAADTVLKCDADLGGGDKEGRVLGVARAAATTSNPVEIISLGPAPAVGSGWTVGAPVYLAVGGGLTQTKPTPSNLVCEVGYASDTDDLFVLKRLVGVRG